MIILFMLICSIVLTYSAHASLLHKLTTLYSINDEIDLEFPYFVFGQNPGRQLVDKKQSDKHKRSRTHKIQQCKDTGEAYSASYLIHKEHLLNQFTNYNLTWVNCEMG